MKSLKHNILFELSHAEVVGYNRSKSQWNSVIYKFIADRFRFKQIPDLLRSYRQHSLVADGPLPHDAAIAWCLLDSVGKEWSPKLQLDGATKNPFEFNVSRVRNFSVCVPSLRRLTDEARPLLEAGEFDLTTDALFDRFPKLAKETQRMVNQGVSRMRKLRKGSLPDMNQLSYDVVFELASLVRLMGQIKAWGIDEYPTNRFFGLE